MKLHSQLPSLALLSQTPILAVFSYYRLMSLIRCLTTISRENIPSPLSANTSTFQVRKSGATRSKVRTGYLNFTCRRATTRARPMTMEGNPRTYMRPSFAAALTGQDAVPCGNNSGCLGYLWKDAEPENQRELSVGLVLEIPVPCVFLAERE